MVKVIVMKLLFLTRLMVQTLHLRRFFGFKVTVKSNERGEVDIEDLKRVVNENTRNYVN